MRRLVTATAILVLLAAGCGDDSAQQARDRRSPSPSVSADATPATDPAEADPTAAPDGGAAGSSGGNQTGNGSGSSTDGGTTQRGQPVQPAPEGSVNRPREGRYTYDLSGSNYNPTMASEQQYPPDSRLFLDMKKNGDEYETKSSTNQRSDTTSTTTRSRWEENRVLFLYLKVSAPPLLEGECTLQPPVEILHIPMKAETFRKQTFRNDSDGCSGEVEIRVEGTEDVTDASGKTWKTWKIWNRTAYRFGQDLQGTNEGYIWFAPDLGNQVKSDNRMQGSYRNGEFRSHNVTLLRAHP